jgi:hypothetical protein
MSATQLVTARTGPLRRGAGWSECEITDPLAIRYPLLWHGFLTMPAFRYCTVSRPCHLCCHYPLARMHARIASMASSLYRPAEFYRLSQPCGSDRQAKLGSLEKNVPLFRQVHNPDGGKLSAAG